VEINKEQILDMLIKQGKEHLIPQAQQKLPAKVDHEKHAGMLQDLGLDPTDVAKNLMGGRDCCSPI
jgi:hypothetical protein